MGLRRRILAPLALVPLVACHLVAGYDDYDFTPEPAPLVGGQGGTPSVGGGGPGGRGGAPPECVAASGCDAPEVCREGACVVPVLWAVDAPTSDGFEAVAAATDGQGRSFLVGQPPLFGAVSEVVGFDPAGQAQVLPPVTYSSLTNGNPRGHVASIATNAGGALHVLANSAHDVSLGNAAPLSSDAEDTFVGRYGVNGNPVCLAPHGGPGFQSGGAIAFAATGAFMAGVYETEITIGGETVGGPDLGEPELWIAALSEPSSCSTLGPLINLASLDIDAFHDLAVDSAARPIVAARFGAEGFIGAQNGVPAGSFVARLAGDLAGTDWVVPIAAPGVLLEIAVDAAPDNRVIVLAAFVGALEVAGQTYPSPTNRWATAVIEITADGEVGWVRVSQGGDAWGHDVVVGDDGAVLVVGEMAGGVDFGGGEVLARDEANMPANDQLRDAFLWSLDAEGNHRWSQSFGAEGTAERARAVAFSPVDGHYVVVGDHQGPLGLMPPEPLPAPSSSAIFVARLAP